MSAARASAFPWRGVLLVWAGVLIGMLVLKRHAIASGVYADIDDIMRLMQVRDLLAGQSWFDLTQHRIAPPEGLAMHWSRLVDIPLLLVTASLSGLVGPARAETVAGIVAPALALLALLSATTVMLRRLFGRQREFMLIAVLFLMSAPIVLVQFFPTRIDHHGWQMAAAAIALAALLDRKPARSGVVCGLALACYLAISIEGLPFAAATIGAAGLLWATGLDRTVRFPIALAALAVAALLCFMLASSGDWGTLYCDALAPGHLAAFAAAATVVALGVRSPLAATPAGRIGIGGIAAASALAGLAAVAPQCIGSPFGTMDPLVHDYWYLNVVEGLPFWRQDAVAATEMVVFPLIGVIGSIGAALSVQGNEARRRWIAVALICIAAALTGMMVRRAAGVATVAALPGAFAMMLWMRAWLTARVRPQLAPLAGALALVGLAPIAPALAVSVFESAIEPARAAAGADSASTKTITCDAHCALLKLDSLPPSLILTGVDAGSRVIAVSRHSVVASGYHRLQIPMRRTIEAFTAPRGQAEARVRATGARYVLVAPESSELGVARERAPDGLMARLADGKTPPWLVEVDLGSPELKLYRLRD